MEQKGLDALVVFGLKGRERLDRYLTNDRTGGIVVFPMVGELVHLTWTAFDIAAHMESSLRGEASWLEDIRVGATGGGVVRVLKEKGLDRQRIGVVGLEGRAPGEPEGWVPYKTWQEILQALPRASFVDVTDAFAELVVVKSEEELGMVRRSACIGELACKAMLEVTKAGVGENEIYATVMGVLYRNGAHGSVSPYLSPLILHSGPDNPSWGPPMWLMRGQTPRIVQEGDIIQAEIFSHYGGMESQQQMSVALPPVHPVNVDLAEIARRSYEAGLKMLRPGNTFGEVAQAMEGPLQEAGCWHLTPLIHSLNPLVWTSATAVGIEALPGIEKYKWVGLRPARGEKLVIEAGMVFELEPNACRGKQRVNIGGTVIVSEKGAEELNRLPTEMRIVGG
jgi:Xaa-Pro aminopeptidase